MNQRTKIALFICILANYSFTLTEEDKIRIAKLRKEIDYLNQEKVKKCDDYNAFVSNPQACADIELDSLHRKAMECIEFNKKLADWQEHYNSPDINIQIRTMINGECYENKIFRIKDKKNGIERDSTFYPHNGDWEVNETNNSAGTYRYRSSWGVKQENLYDKQGYVIHNILVNKNNDTVLYNQYFWENGRLVKTRIKGIERIFTYGTPCDSVVVNPPDFSEADFNPPPVYNRSFGLIPEEGDPEYERFKRWPYQYRAPPELLERQKRRCEEYKATQKKKGSKK